MSIKSSLAGAALVLTAITAPTTPSRSAECSFESAVIIQSAWAVATLDAILLGNTPQAQQAAQQEFDGILPLAPPPCIDEMRASFSSEMANLCANNVAWPVMTQSLNSMAADYRTTGNREAFKSSVLAAINTYMTSLPRRCWLAQMPLTQTPPIDQCRLFQQQHAACEAQAKAAIQQCLGRPKNMGPCPTGPTCGPQPIC